MMLRASFALLLVLTSARADPAFERELKQLTEQRDAALATASAPIHARFKTAAEQLLKRATQSNDLDSANKIRAALDRTPTPAGEGGMKSPRQRLAGIKWQAVPGMPIRGGLAPTLTFQDGTVEPGGYKYEVRGRNVTITFNGGDTQEMQLVQNGQRLEFTHGRTAHAYTPAGP